MNISSIVIIISRVELLAEILASSQDSLGSDSNTQGSDSNTFEFENNIPRVRFEDPSTGGAPNKATLASNFLWVAWHLQKSAVKQRKYPEIKTSDYVRVKMHSNTRCSRSSQAPQLCTQSVSFELGYSKQNHGYSISGISI